jgi:hypothetical protein
MRVIAIYHPSQSGMSDKTTKIRAVMSSKRSAVKPRECENVPNDSHRSITFEQKMEVICRMQDGKTRPDVC